MKDFAIDVERLSPENHTKRCYPATCCLTNDDVIIKVFPKSKKNKNNGKMKISDINIQSDNINSTGTCIGICSFVISNFETNVEAQQYAVDMIHVQTSFCICKTRCLFIFTKMTCILILKKNNVLLLC